MNINIKKISPDAKIPTYSTDGSACFDFYAYYVSSFNDRGKISGNTESSCLYVDTGIAMEIPEGYVMQIFSRSGHGFKNSVRLANCVGIIDSDYRGELKIKLQGDFDSYLEVKIGDRIAQGLIVPIPKVSFIEVDNLNETQRGVGGFGSTGK